MKYFQSKVGWLRCMFANTCHMLAVCGCLSVWRKFVHDPLASAPPALPIALRQLQVQLQSMPSPSISFFPSMILLLLLLLLLLLVKYYFCQHKTKFVQMWSMSVPNKHFVCPIYVPYLLFCQHREDNVVKSSNDDYASADHDPTHRPNLYAGGPRIN